MPIPHGVADKVEEKAHAYMPIFCRVCVVLLLLVEF